MNDTKQFAEVMNRLARVAPPPIPRRAAIAAGGKKEIKK